MTRVVPRLETYPGHDGAPLALRRFEVPPGVRPRGHVVLLHGLVSHGGWYLESGAHLAGAGLQVHALDRRGSGRNRHGRGDVDSEESWLADVEGYLADLGTAAPTILLGVSWGGKLAVAIGQRGRARLAGIGLLCPGIFAYQQARLPARLGIGLGNACGLGSLSVPLPLQDPALFTATPRWQAYVRDDPQALRRITLRFARANLALNARVQGGPRQLQAALMLAVAGRDRVADNARNVAFFEGLAAPDKQVLRYPEASHTLEFEPDPGPFLTDLAAWCRRVVEADGA